MKLPRWLVIGMLTSSVLAVLAAAGRWWVTWPERTATEFVQMLVEGNRDEVHRMSGFESYTGSYIMTYLSTSIDCGPESLECEARTMNDYLHSRQAFKLPGMPSEFTVVRGKIIHPGLFLFRDADNNDHLGIIQKSEDDEKEMEVFVLRKTELTP